MTMTRRTVDALPELDMHRLEREVKGLRTALESRAVIEQAKGIIMGAMNCDAKRAFEVLVRQSQHENRKLHEVARELVTQRSPGTTTGLSRGGSPR
jgi:AmiR/NasT family two-component response regulator